MISEAAKKASRKYDLKTTKMISVKLNKNTDADILRHIEKIDNKQSYIKALIRKEMKEEE
jgi:hypothetical protein